MSRLGRGLTLCLLIASLTGSTLSWPRSARADWQTVPAGWTATEPGYFGTIADGRDTLAALQTYRETSERWKAAYSDLRTEFITSTEEINKKIAGLEEQLNNERKAWQAEANKNPIWGAVGIIVGLLAGR
jgi:hypothetical protein